MKKSLSTCLIAVVATCSLSFSNNNLYASTPLGFEGDNAATVGIVVRDLKTGKNIHQFNHDKLMSPASTMKLVTSASALSLVGKDFRYETSAYIKGKVDSKGILRGNIVIETSGDPTLYSSHFPEGQTFIADVVAALKERGVKSIGGQILVDDSSMPEQGQVSTWEIEDACYSYGAGYFQTNFCDNIFVLNTATEKTEPNIPFIETYIVKTDSGSREITHGVNSPKYVVEGPNVLSPKSNAYLPMFNPAEALVDSLQSAISHSGIVFNETECDVEADSIPLATHYSPLLLDIMKSLMTRSDNMMAESTLRLLAPNQPRHKAIKREKEFLESIGVDCSYSTIRDGSGLTRSNSLQPDFLANVLEKMAAGDNASDFISLFPKAGVSGTMKSFLANSPLKGRLAMKTGSMSEVRCYAGYLLDDQNQPTHVVVVMVNRYKCNGSDLIKSIEKYLLKTLK